VATGDSPSRRGVYTAERASALSGVPKSTLYEWAREPRPVVVPSVSSKRIKLWSWTDLVALRAVYWLRHPLERDRRPTTMERVRSFIAAVEREAERVGDALAQESVVLRADRAGRIYLHDQARDVMTVSPDWVPLLGTNLVVDLLATFSPGDVLTGPDLRQPRASLRIIPGKLAGEPHVAGTRIETRTLAALAERSMSEGDILRLYPDLTVDSLGDALDLEQQLERNLRAAA